MNEERIVERPPIEMQSKASYTQAVNEERFNEVCGAIARYWDQRLPIPLDWVQEYNDLLEYFKVRGIDIKI